MLSDTNYDIVEYYRQSDDNTKFHNFINQVFDEYPRTNCDDLYYNMDQVLFPVVFPIEWETFVDKISKLDMNNIQFMLSEGTKFYNFLSPEEDAALSSSLLKRFKKTKAAK